MQSSFNLIETLIELVNVCERVIPLGKQKKKVGWKGSAPKIWLVIRILLKKVILCSNNWSPSLQTPLADFTRCRLTRRLGSILCARTITTRSICCACMSSLSWTSYKYRRNCKANWWLRCLLQLQDFTTGLQVSHVYVTILGLVEVNLLGQDLFTTGLGNVMENCTTAAVLMLDRYYNSPDKAGAIDKILKTDVDPLRIVPGAVTEQFFNVRAM